MRPGTWLPFLHKNSPFSPELFPVVRKNERGRRFRESDQGFPLESLQEGRLPQQCHLSHFRLFAPGLANDDTLFLGITRAHENRAFLIFQAYRAIFRGSIKCGHEPGIIMSNDRRGTHMGYREHSPLHRFSNKTASRSRLKTAGAPSEIAPFVHLSSCHQGLFSIYSSGIRKRPSLRV